jgi:Response regulator containing CheY-like receiver, AAA-type ATPase, and DNA-binding domains
MHVFIVEDDILIRRALSRAVRASGHNVTECSTVEQAVRIAGQLAWDVLVTDWDLPDGIGGEILARVRRHHAIVHSASSDVPYPWRDEYLFVAKGNNSIARVVELINEF